MILETLVNKVLNDETAARLYKGPGNDNGMCLGGKGGETSSWTRHLKTPPLYV